MAAYKIQQWYWEIKHNPRYASGRKHINNMYDEIVKSNFQLLVLYLYQKNYKEIKDRC